MRFLLLSEEVERKQESTPEKEVLKSIAEQHADLWQEVANITALLNEVGIRSYKLTGSVQDPIIVGYSIS